MGTGAQGANSGAGGLLSGFGLLGNPNRPGGMTDGANPFDLLNNAKDQSAIAPVQTGSKTIADRLPTSPTSGMSDDELQNYDKAVTEGADRLKASQPPIESVQATDVTGQNFPAKPPMKSPFNALSQDSSAVVNDTPSASASPLTATTTPASATANADTARTAAIPADVGEGDDDASGPLSGLFGPKIQGYAGIMKDKLGDAATNPLFQLGMGLMASGYDGSNPYANILKNVNGIQANQIAGQSADLARNKDAREQQLSELQMAQLAALMKFNGQTGVQDPLNPISRGSMVIKSR